MKEEVVIDDFNLKDIEQAKKMLKVTISQNFKNNNITNRQEIEDEINAQIKLVIDYFENKLTCTAMYGAKLKDKLIGIVAIGSQTPKIKKHIETNFRDVLEIKNLYILPEHQKQGLGKKLFNAACEGLLKMGETHFMLYSSFKTGQTYWQKMLGKTYKTVEDDGIIRKIWLQEIKFLEV
jgi:GNAT superfamily N-acetyltransferase